MFRVDDLERRYDGPIPPADPAACRIQARLRARLFDRLARETAGESTRRRRHLNAAQAVDDRRLKRLGSTLHAYRAHGVAWSSAG